MRVKDWRSNPPSQAQQKVCLMAGIEILPDSTMGTVADRIGKILDIQAQIDQLRLRIEKIKHPNQDPALTEGIPLRVMEVE
jgi:hypothetical protein